MSHRYSRRSEGVIDSLRVRIQQRLAEADREDLQKQGWRRGFHVYRTNKSSAVGEMWHHKNRGVRVLCAKDWTDVEGSLPEVLGRDNAQVDRLDSNLTREAFDQLTWKLLVNTSRTRVKGKETPENLRTRWALRRIDLARDFIGPVPVVIELLRTSRLPHSPRDSELTTYQNGGQLLRFGNKDFSVSIYNKGAQTKAKRAQRFPRERAIRSVIVGNNDWLGRVEVSYRSKAGLIRFLKKLDGIRKAPQTASGKRPRPFLALRVQVNEGVSRVVPTTLFDLHQLLRDETLFLESPLNIKVAKSLPDVAIQAMADEPARLAAYLCGGASRDSKRDNRTKVAAIRRAMLRRISHGKSLIDLLYPLWPNLKKPFAKEAHVFQVKRGKGLVAAILGQMPRPRIGKRDEAP